ncbi:hypothetical protein GCM10008994_02720 [Halorubrum ejinorense]
MEHDDATDTHSGRPTSTAGDGTAGPAERSRFGPTFGLSTFQVAVIGLTLLVALAGVAATAPAAAGLSPLASPSAAAGSTGPVAVEAVGSAGPAERPEISGGFSRETYTATAGDQVEIRHANPDGPAYLLIGGNRLTDTGQSVGFVDVIKLDGQTTTTINTRTIGTDATNVESCANTTCDLEFRDENGNLVAENLSELSSATGAGGLARPLVPQRYRLAITNGTFVVDDSGVVTPTEVADQADLVLEKPTLHDDVEVFTSIDPSALDEESETESLSALRENGLDRTAVTKGNRVVLGFESTGIWGALSHFAEEELEPGQEVDPDVLDDLLSADEGVSLRVRETNPGRNQPAAELDISRADPEDVRLFIADATELETPDAPGRFYLVIDTSDGDHFTEPPEPGDEFAVEFALEGTEGKRYAFADDREPPAAFNPTSGPGDAAQFPYWETADSTVRAEATFTVAERYLRYDAVTDDGELLVAAEDGRITGTTSLLPVRELSATLVNDASDAPFRTESPLEISNGNFTIDAGLDGVSPGTRLNYELHEGSTLRDSRTVVVVGDTDNPDRLVIDDAPENVTVTEDRNLSSIRVTARNTGGLAGEGELTLGVANGSATGSWGVRLAPNESRTFDFGSVTADLDPGTYPFTLSLDDDTHNGTLVVEADPAKTTLDDDEGEASDGTDNGTDTGGSGNGTDVSGNGTDDGAGSDSRDGDGSGSGSDGESNSTQDSDGEGGSDDTTGGDAPADDSADDVGMIPLPFGTREAFGGTVLVGAVHLLGHWV